MRSRVRFVCFCGLLSLTLTCQAQPTRGEVGSRARSSRDTLLRLLDMLPVRNEIGLRPLQIEMLDDLQADLAEQRRAVHAGAGRLEIPDQQRSPEAIDEATRQRLEAMRTAIQRTRQQSEQLIAVILDSQQAKRIEELRLQDEGTRALDRQELRDQLNVTDEQFREIQELRLAALNRSRSPGRRQRDLDRRVLELLTAEQQRKFIELQGEPFEFPLRADLGGLRAPQENNRRRRPGN